MEEESYWDTGELEPTDAPPRRPLRDRYTYEEPRRGSRYAEHRREYEPRARQEDARRRKKRGRGRLAVCLILLLVLVAGGVYYVFFYMLGGLTLRNITHDHSLLGINSAVLSDSSIKNIALFGLDSREDDGVGRSDALMVLTVDNKHDKIKLTSILRDSNVSIRRTDEDGSIYYMDDKITHAYAYGGPETAINTLNRNFNLDIEDYVTVNFAQMAKIVDALGGVDMEISPEEIVEINKNLRDLWWEIELEKMEDAENGVYGQIEYAKIADSDYFRNAYGEAEEEDPSVFTGGVYRLNGNQAVAYARIRHIDGDDARAGRQQKVLKALLDGLKNKSKLEYPDLIHTLMPLCETSLDFGDIMDMSPIVLTDFTFETLSIPNEEEADFGFNSQGSWVYVYDLEAAANRLGQFIYEEDAVAVTLGSDVTDVVAGALAGNYDENTDEGYDPSYDENTDQGYDESYDPGYDENSDQGYDDGYDAGNDESYGPEDIAYDEGYTE